MALPFQAIAAVRGAKLAPARFGGALFAIARCLCRTCSGNPEGCLRAWITGINPVMTPRGNNGLSDT